MHLAGAISTLTETCSPSWEQAHFSLWTGFRSAPYWCRQHRCARVNHEETGTFASAASHNEANGSSNVATGDGAVVGSCTSPPRPATSAHDRQSGSAAPA